MSSIKTWQGTTTVNNLVVNGNVSINDFKYIQSYTGTIEVLDTSGKFPGDAAASTGIPTTKMMGIMRQRPSVTQMILEFRLQQENKTDFDLAPTVSSAGVLPGIPTGDICVVAAKAKRINPQGDILGANLTVGDIDFQQDQTVFIIMQKGTTASDYNVEIFYEVSSSVDTDPIQYGWTATDVVASDITANFDVFLGDISGSIQQLLDAGKFFKLVSTSAL